MLNRRPASWWRLERLSRTLPAQRHGLVMASVLSFLLLWGCAAYPGPRTATVASEDLPFGLSAAQEQSQHLFRARLQSGSGDVDLRLVLRLETLDDFHLSASDPAGRALWSLVIGERSVFLDHRQERACTLEADDSLLGPPGKGVRAQQLALLLLSRLPATPASPVSSQGDEQRFRDQKGRKWTFSLAGEDLTAWSMKAFGRRQLTFRSDERGNMLTTRRGVRLAWTTVAAESLVLPIAEIEIPRHYRWLECDGEYLP